MRLDFLSNSFSFAIAFRFGVASHAFLVTIGKQASRSVRRDTLGPGLLERCKGLLVRPFVGVRGFEPLSLSARYLKPLRMPVPPHSQVASTFVGGARLVS